jgi:hypothetical protein
MPNNILNLDLPDDWENVTQFLDWYIANKMPINLPYQPEVFLSDDATAVSLFRHNQFQVELYLIHPFPNVPIHEHPNVDVIKVRLNKINGEVFADYGDPLTKGKSHGVGAKLSDEDKGFPLFAVQHWKTEHPPTTVAAQWKGKTVGPKQEALIRRFHPDALVISGYADVTKTMGNLKELKHAKSA